MDQLLRQCAEVGIWRITPVSTAREVAKSGRDDVPERWCQHLVEGCKQAHNPFLPAIESTRSLANALSTAGDHAERWYGAVPIPGEPLPAPSTVPPNPAGGDIAWLVGPEGGFTPAEDETIRAAGFQALSLGPWVLRVETAAIVGAAVLARDTRKD
jgi:16S rRNA (uracil1498-N3)-methyltransferase